MPDSTPSVKPVRRLTRRDAATYLLEVHGIRHSEQTLARKAVEGTGPAFSRFGRAVIYTVEDLDAYAGCGTSAPRRSTAQHEAADAINAA